MWTPGTWGEQMFTDGRFFSHSATRLVGRCEEWPISCVTDARGWTELYSGKRGMVRAGGSASRIIGDRSATEPGGGRRVPGWQKQVGRVRGSHWTPNTQGFRPLGATPQRIADGVNVRCRMTLEKCLEGEGGFRVGRSKWGVSADLTGPQIHRVFGPWGPLHNGLQTA